MEMKLNNPPQSHFTTMASNYNNTNNNNALEEIERWRAAMWAQWEHEDQEMEQLVWEAQMHAEEEHRREEQRRIGEQKQIAEAEQQWRLAELQ